MEKANVSEFSVKSKNNALFKFKYVCTWITDAGAESYEMLLKDVALVCTLVVVYYILANKSIIKIYLFDTPNVLLLLLGICTYHLVISRIASLELR
jgi:hypothetical protein